MIPIRRVTGTTVDVLQAMLAGPEPVWGLKIIKETGRLPGTVYPILERLESQGWVTSSWEVDEARSGPRRRFYELTPAGKAAATETCRAYGRRLVVRARGQVAVS